MSRYNELCRKYEIDLNRGFKYRDECHHFLAEFYKALSESFQTPPQKLFLLSTDDEEATHSVLKAIELGEDGFYHIKILIEVEINEKTYPKERLSFEVLVKKPDLNLNNFIIKFLEDKEFIVKYHNANTDFSEFLDHFFDLASNFYEERWKRFLSGNRWNPVGFKTEQINNKL